MPIILIEEIEKVLARFRARGRLSERECIAATAEHFGLPVETVQRVDAGTAEAA